MEYKVGDLVAMKYLRMLHGEILPDNELGLIQEKKDLIYVVLVQGKQVRLYADELIPAPMK